MCRCAVSHGTAIRASPRTQASLAVSADGAALELLNASPDLRAQIAATPALHPRGAMRGSPIEAVVLTGAEIDQTAGLSEPARAPALHALRDAETLAALGANPMFDALAPDVVTRRAIAPGTAVRAAGGLTAELFTVPGKVPLYLEGGTPETVERERLNVGVEIAARRRAALLRAGRRRGDAGAARAARRAPTCMLFDGTLFTDDEMIASGTGEKTGRRMGHMPIDGADGSLAASPGLASGASTSTSTTPIRS